MGLLWLSAAFALGALLGLLLRLPWESAVAFGAAALVAVAVAWLRRWPLLPALMVAALSLGLVRASLVSLSPDALARYHSSPATLRGVVVSDPAPAGRALRFPLEVQAVHEADGWRPLDGTALVVARVPPEVAPEREPPTLRYGDLVTLEGVVKAPPPVEEFDYPAYLARQGVHSVLDFPQVRAIEPGHGNPLRRGLSALRLRLADAVAGAVPEPQSSVDRALLLGLRSDIPDGLREAFRRTGTSHLLAISGLHVGIVLAMFLVAAQALLGRRRGLYLLVPLGGVWLYAALAGMAPPVVRAALMGSLYLWALYLGRPRSAFPAIGAAAAVMLAIQPALLWSVSFQLSFAAVAGLALLGPPIQRALDGWWPTHLDGGIPGATAFKGMVSMSLAAILATLPLVAFHFQYVSLVGLPATLLTLPAMPLVLLTSLAASLAHLALAPLGQALGWLAWLTTAYITGVVEAFARVPAVAVQTGAVATPLVVAYYALLAVAVWMAQRLPRDKVAPAGLGALGALRGGRAWPLPSWRWVLPPLLLGTALVWVAALALPGPRLAVTVLDVGQGDAILIQTPDGHQVLVDGGPQPLSAVRGLGERLPFWDRSLDLVVLTHPQADHVTGLTEVLRRYRVGTVLTGPLVEETASYRLWQRAVEDSGARVITASTGQVLWLGQVRLQVLNPPSRPWVGTTSDVNNASVVLRLSYGQVDLLLTGDLSADGERLLLHRDLVAPSEVLKVGHHGSATSTTAELLEVAAPSVAVISAGQDNPFGHPSPEVVARLEGALPPGQVVSTAHHGDVTLSTDGQRLWMELEGR